MNIKMTDKTMKLNLANKYCEQDITVVAPDVAGSGIIEVTELPTENIDENAIYKLVVDTFTIGIAGDGMKIKDYASFVGMQTNYYRVSDKPTENIEVSDLINSTKFACYYVENENDIFVYGDVSNSGKNQWISISVVFNGYSFQGVVTNLDEMINEGYYVYSFTKTDSALYKYDKTFENIIIGSEGQGLYLSEYFSQIQLPLSYECYYTTTLADTDAIVSCFENGLVLYIYYVEEENNLFVYFKSEEDTEPQWVTLAEVFDFDLTFNGFVDGGTDTTIEGFYAIGSKGFRKYITPMGDIIFNENGTYDVFSYKKAVVNVCEIAGVWKFDVQNFDLYVTTGQWTENVNFTVRVGHEIVKCKGMTRGPKGLFYFITESREYLGGYSFPWRDGNAEAMVDFGDVPQVITQNFDIFMNANAVSISKLVISPDAEISFMINDVTYSAKPNMTWEEWVNSNYNTIGCYIQNDNIYMSNGTKPIKTMQFVDLVYSTYIIKHGIEYFDWYND